MGETIIDLGKADWMWDAELGTHIPCCSQLKGRRRCGNGPLVGDAIWSGDCGDHVVIDTPKVSRNYEYQETHGYGELIQDPDLNAPWPSGMCGKKTVCDACPSNFLCVMKASEEMKVIRGRTTAHE